MQSRSSWSRDDPDEWPIQVAVSLSPGPGSPPVPLQAPFTFSSAAFNAPPRTAAVLVGLSPPGAQVEIPAGGGTLSVHLASHSGEWKHGLVLQCLVLTRVG
jgi:hypothetical protein